MALPATHFLPSIVPADATNTGCLDRLAINNSSSWLYIASRADPRSFSECCVHLVRYSVQAPLPPIMEARLPREQIPWQQTSRTSTANNVENRTQNLSSTTLTFGRIWLDNQPLHVRKISVIALVLHILQPTTVFLRQFLACSMLGWQCWCYGAIALITLTLVAWKTSPFLVPCTIIVVPAARSLG